MRRHIPSEIRRRLRRMLGAGGNTTDTPGARPRTDGGTGTAPPTGTAPSADAVSTTLDDTSLGFHDVLHLLNAPVLVLDADGEVVVWNEPMADLTGNTEAEAKAADSAAAAWYHDGGRSMTLADKILDAPERAHEAYDVERLDGYGFTLYQDESEFVDADGGVRHIRFSAAPMYDGGELVGVVEYVEDRTADVKRQRELVSLVDELTATMHDIEGGDFAARAEPPEAEHIDEELLAVVDALNRLSARLGETVGTVSERADALLSSAETLDGTSDGIAANATEQRESLAQVTDELNEMSATVEEIAASSDQIATSAERTAELTAEGDAIAAEASAAMHTVSDTGAAVREDVMALQRQVEEVDTVVEVINTIADQTNLLALNASIEAARASRTNGGNGDGFTVVADEVKALAEDTKRRVDEIEAMVETMTSRSDRAVESIAEMADAIDTGADKVDAVADRLDAITREADETADGIEEVARATEDQAVSTEEVATMAEDVRGQADEVAQQAAVVAEASEENHEASRAIRDAVDRLTGD